jgi:DNA-directed RNA polymerase subunit beta'
MGGTAGRIAAQSKEESRRDGTVQFKNVTFVVFDGVQVATGRNGEIHVVDEKDRILGRYKVPYGSHIKVKDESKVKKGTVLVEWDPYNSVMVSDEAGKASFVDIMTDEESKKHRQKTGTLREEFDEQTGLLNQVIVDHRDRILHPRVLVIDSHDKKLANYPIPTGAYLQVKDGQSVKAGEIIAKLPHESTKTRDITGGLPRVAELFEARAPKDPAVIAEIDGNVEFGDIEKGMRNIIIRDEHNEMREYGVPVGKH